HAPSRDAPTPVSRATSADPVVHRGSDSGGDRPATGVLADADIPPHAARPGHPAPVTVRVLRPPPSGGRNTDPACRLMGATGLPGKADVATAPAPNTNSRPGLTRESH